MGVKSNKVVSLLKEDISTGFARILGDFINASAKGASEIKLASILKKLNDDERKFLDEFIQDAKKAGKSGDISLNDLVTGIAKIDAYKALVKTIQSNQDIFFSTLGKKFNIKSLPTALTSKQQADLIMGKLYNSTNPQVRNIVQKLETGGTGLLPAERTLFVGELRKLNDDTANKIADELESGFKILDDVDTELKGGSKTVDAEYDELVFDEVSGEWVSKAEKEAGDASKGADDVADEISGEPESLFSKEMDEASEYTSAEKLKYDELSSKSDEEIKKILKDLANFRSQNKTGEISTDGAMVLDIARDRNLITEDDYLKIITPYDKAGWTDFFAFARKTKERQKGKIVDTKINPYTGKEEKITVGKKIEDRLSEAKNEYNKATDPKTKEKIQGEILELEGLRDDDFEKYIKGISLRNGKQITSDYAGFAMKTLGSKKLSTILDFLETGVGKYGTKTTAKWWGRFGLIAAGLGLFNLAVEGASFGSDVADLVAERTGLDEFSTVSKLVNWSTLAEPKILVNGAKISACPGNKWCGIGISKTQFKLIDSSLGIFVTKTPLNGDNYIYKFVPTKATDLDKDYVIVVPKDSGSLTNEMKITINEYVKQATGKDYYAPEELTKQQIIGGKVADETGVSNFLATTPTKPTIEAKTLKLVEKGTDGIDKYTVNLVLPNGDKYAGYKLKFNTKDGTWASNQ